MSSSNGSNTRIIKIRGPRGSCLEDLNLEGLDDDIRAIVERYISDNKRVDESSELEKNPEQTNFEEEPSQGSGLTNWEGSKLPGILLPHPNRNLSAMSSDLCSCTGRQKFLRNVARSDSDERELNEVQRARSMYVRQRSGSDEDPNIGGAEGNATRQISSRRSQRSRPHFLKLLDKLLRKHNRRGRY